MAKQMINQLELIKKILHNDFLQKDNDAKILIEKITVDNIMKRDIKAHHGIEYLLYRYDPNKTRLFPFFADEAGLKKICDYILFAQEGQHLYLLLIELKLGIESATKQLLASECFAEFILSSAKRIGIELTENISIKKIRVSEERAKQRNRKTKPGPLLLDENQIINYDHSDCFRIKEVLEI